jgi:acyl-CoA thioester hydrolase
MRLEFKLPEDSFRTIVRVRWADTDAAGIAYNGTYLTWLEVARVEYFRCLAAHHLNVPITDSRVQDDLQSLYPLTFILASAAIDFRAPLRVDSRLRITIATSRIGRSSLEHRYQLTHAVSSQLIALAETTVVHVNAQSLRPDEIPSDLRTHIEQFESALKSSSVRIDEIVA